MQTLHLLLLSDNISEGVYQKLFSKGMDEKYPSIYSLNTLILYLYNGDIAANFRVRFPM